MRRSRLRRKVEEREEEKEPESSSVFSRVPPTPDILNTLLDYEMELEHFKRRLTPYITIDGGIEVREGPRRAELLRAMKLMLRLKFLCSRVAPDFGSSGWFPNYLLDIEIQMGVLRLVMKTIFDEPLPPLVQLLQQMVITGQQGLDASQPQPETPHGTESN